MRTTAPRLPLWLIASGAAFIAAHPAQSATPEGLFAARGIGALPCNAVADTEGDERAATISTMSSWIAGYLSHANRTTADRFEVSPILDNAVLASILVQFCGDNPTVLVETVFASMMASIEAGGQESESGIVELTAGTSTTSLRSGTLIKAQQVLADAKLLEQVDVDGAFGPRTRDAITAYQKQNSLTETQLPDPVTLLHLFSGSQR